MLIEDYFKRYQLLNPRLRSYKSVDAMAVDLKTLNEFYRVLNPNATRGVSISDLSAELVSGAAGWIVKRGRQPATANRFLRHVMALWRFAVDDEGLTAPVNPIPKIRKHKEPKRVPEAWSVEEFERLVAAASKAPGYVGTVPASLWWPTLILTIYWTGVRISAVMALRVEDVNVVHGSLRFPAEIQKHFADQVFSIPQELIDLHRKLNPAARGHKCVFDDWPRDRSGTWGWKYLNKGFGDLCKEAGLQSDRRGKFHKIRRTFATQVCVSAGKGAAQMLLGHASMNTTERYLDPRFLERPNPVTILTPITVPDSLRIVG